MDPIFSMMAVFRWIRDGIAGASLAGRAALEAAEQR
jgi:hypothetical protein